MKKKPKPRKKIVLQRIEELAKWPRVEPPFIAEQQPSLEIHKITIRAPEFLEMVERISRLERGLDGANKVIVAMQAALAAIPAAMIDIDGQRKSLSQFTNPAPKRNLWGRLLKFLGF